MNKEELIAELRQAAERFDLFLSRPENLHVHVRYGDAKRDVDNPPFMSMSATDCARASEHGWYISPEDLNTHGPDEFVALDGTRVQKTQHGYVNPYGATGFTGPGVLGYGRTEDGRPTPESRAVDIVIQFIDPQDGKLKFIGGIRSDTRQPCFVGGFQEKDAFETATREFIEESISGSISLEKFAPQLNAACQMRKNGLSFSDKMKAYLKGFSIDPEHFTGDRGEAAYRFIAREDPGFVERLTGYFKAKLTVAYQGPCRADPRTTDQRWIASTLLTGLIDLAEITALLEGQKFPYRFAAGSDLSDVKLHAFDPAFVQTAFASHGPMACLAVAHNLQTLDRIPDAVIGQCRNVLDAIDKAIAPQAMRRPSQPAFAPSLAPSAAVIG